MHPGQKGGLPGTTYEMQGQGKGMSLEAHHSCVHPYWQQRRPLALSGPEGNLHVKKASHTQTPCHKDAIDILRERQSSVNVVSSSEDPLKTRHNTSEDVFISP